MIEITASAASQLRALIAEKGLDQGTGLRLAIEKGGCAGLQYAMTIGAPEASDQLIERDGAKFYVDTESATLLDGCSIDYEDGLAGAGFRVNNPKAVRSCGCGTSFEPATDSPA